MVYECGDLLAEGERFPDGPRMTVADVDLDRLRQERIRQGTHDDNRRTHDARIGEFRTVEFELQPPTGDIGLRRKVDRFPFVPDDPERLALDCYEAYNIQVSGLEQRLAAHRHTEGDHRGQRRARLDPRPDRRRPGDGPARSTAQRHPRLHDAGLRDRRPDHARTPLGWPSRWASRSRRSTSPRPRARCSPTSTTRSPTASRSTTSRSRTCRPACATTTCSAWPTTAAASWSAPATSRELALGWCTYGVGDQMSHYNVNAGVPKTLVQHLIRWVVRPRRVRRGHQRVAPRDRRAGDHSRADPGRRRARSQAVDRGPRSGPTTFRTSRSTT